MSPAYSLEHDCAHVGPNMIITDAALKSLPRTNFTVAARTRAAFVHVYRTFMGLGIRRL
jgi:hypothetical protein